ncbi:MAG: YjbH domain-containing protein, partial [Perlucidibaca sp.]
YDQIGWSGVPDAVAVLGENGAPCTVAYQPKAPVRAYLQACHPERSPGEILLVSPDGRVTQVPVADWNAVSEPVILPGSWLWLPLPGIRDDDQMLLARQVGTLGPYLPGSAPASAGADAQAASAAPDAPDAAAAPATDASPVQAPDASAQALNRLPVSSSDWGGVGLLQTPTARMRDTGSVAVTLNHAQPYTRLNVMLQPLDWLEAGFRYTEISNRDYGTASSSGQTFKDKSLDAKVRLLREGEQRPELALGFRDIAGTGLFSGEYLVGSKRWQQWDFSLGLGWGYVGARGDIDNPVGFLISSYEDRETAQPGGDNTGEWFKGPVSLFGGLAWHSLTLPLTLKLEYDGNDYRNEPLGNRFDASLPINLGATWRVFDGMELQAALERGDTLSLGLTFHTNLARQNVDKINDPAPVTVRAERPAAGNQTDWAGLAGRIQAQTGSPVQEMRVSEQEVRVQLGEPAGFYLRPKATDVARLLHNEAPASADWFVLGYQNAGLATQDVAINRDALVQRDTQWLPEDRKPALMSSENPVRPLPGEVVYSQPQPQRLSTTVGLDFDQILGGPDSFVLFNLDAIAGARYNFSDNTWLSGTASLRLFDNFDDFRYDGPSGLPRVRTDERLYLTDSAFNVRNLQLTHTLQPSSDQYVMFYGGLLERMFAGVGAEWMYRPYGSPVAVGVDLNRVQQRDYDQGFGLRDARQDVRGGET